MSEENEVLRPVAPASVENDIILPKDYNVYISQINEKVNNLINQSIWRGIEKTKLRQWQKNFETDEEKYFAACILDTLIYRNDMQTQSMLFDLISMHIPNLFLKHKPLNVNPYISLFGFRNNVETNVRFVCVKAEYDGPTKSSHFIARMLKRKNLINDKWFVTPDAIKHCIASNIKCFIFIDDFLGTGNQFTEMATEIELNKLMTDKEVFVAYAPLTAHVNGITHLKGAFPELKLVCVEQLDDDHSVFRSAFNDDVNVPDKCKKFYCDFMKRKSGISTLPDSEMLGYGELELSYAFEQAVPDNNLQLMYWNRNSTINSLFNR